ncbi:uncharacterized protein LOC135845868 [Planococcus citri]|uniref:uncharacterized protein LOC135845868 n=1 Tax=Planococcus citri TaxID=170843 RepID=UPI0031F768FD
MGTFMTLTGYLYSLQVILANIVLVSSANYKQYFVESDNLCSLGFTPKRLHIGRDENSGLLVEEISYFKQLSGKYPYNCKFTVESTAEMGVFAVIQKLKLRKNTTTGECIDYVQFRHSSALQLGVVDINIDPDPWGVKHCGDVNAMEVEFTDAAPLSLSNVLPNAFIDPKGKIDVKIFVKNQTIPPGMDLDLKIAFTSYQVCRFNMGNYKKCSSDACIWYTYFNDKILNCPFTSCADEGGCQLVYDAAIKPSAGLATKVMVGAVAGVFTMFIVFVMFLWLFRHCSVCWNDSPQNSPNNSQMRPVPTVDDVQPTAPHGSPSLDKDLPPSYESLFPNA